MGVAKQTSTRRFLKPEDLKPVARKKFTIATKILEIPELNRLVGLPPIDEQQPILDKIESLKQELSNIEKTDPREQTLKEKIQKYEEEIGVAAIKIQQLGFDEVVTLTTEATDRGKKMIDDIASAAAYDGDTKAEARFVLKQMSIDTQYRIKVIKAGVVEPALSDEILFWLSKHFGMTLTTIYNEIMMLTQQGADVKKNSTD